jgi:hypothetical protein
MLNGNKRETGRLAEDSVRHRHVQNRAYAAGEPGSLGQRREIYVLVRGISERLTVIPGLSAYVGRFHPLNRVELQLDLTPYGVERYGISRVHACFDLDYAGRLYLTDMNSSNGTIVAGKRLRPYMPAVLHHGDEVVFGSLLVRIGFAADRAST